MLAACFHGRHDLRIEEIPVPEPGPGDVLLRVLHAGICGTDVHELSHGPIFTPGTTPHPLTGVVNPVVLGHELSGEVLAVGGDVSRVRPGDLVAVYPLETCGTCARCLEGATNLCPVRAGHGLARGHGAFAELTLIRESMAFPVPPGTDPRRAALVEPISVGMHAARRSGAGLGSTVAVLGAGPIGLGTALCLGALGARVVLSDPSARRREAALALGFEHVLDPTASDPVEAIHALTDGRGADACVDAAGVPAALEAAIAATRRDGLVVVVAVPTSPIVLDVHRFRAGEVRLTMSAGPLAVDFDDVIALMSQGHFAAEGWVTEIAFGDILEGGFGPLARGEEVKVLVDVAGTARRTTRVS
jgi:(R,R)-butanediol dehydrogenase/meso-butanediol dehydrogenase/diacetyl reductase